MQNTQLHDENIGYIQNTIQGTNFSEHKKITQILQENQEAVLIEHDNTNYQELEELEFEHDGIPIEFKKICRTCLTDKYELKSLFENDCIPEMIMTFAQIKIRPDDDLPRQVCSACITQLSNLWAFKQQIEQVDATLRDYIQREYFDGIGINTAEPVEIELPSETNQNTLEEHIILDDDIIQKCSSSVSDLKDMNDLCDENFERHQGESQYIETAAIQLEYSEEHTNNIIEMDYSSEEQKYESALNEKLATTKQVPRIHIIKKEEKKKKKKRRLKILSDSESDESENFVCNQCGKVYSSGNKLTRHLKTHPKLECNFCGKKYTDVTDLNKHLKAHILLTDISKKYPFSCKECHVGFTLESDLQIHSSIHSKDGTFICLYCSKNCESSSKLRRHVRIHFEDKPHKCKICYKGFPEMGSLTRHFRKHTGEQRERKYICHCGKSYYDSHTLGTHMRTHTGERPCVCAVCGKCFIDKRLLNSHMKVHSDDKPFKCDICEKSFTHQSTLTTHVRTHTGEKPYTCTVCGKSFIQSSNLALHMRVHSGEKPYICNVCARGFASSSTLTMHMRVHTGEKPYACPECGKKFARYDMSSHMRTHSGEKPYECSECQKKFTTSGQLSQHSRIHTGVKPYVCNICNKACTSATYMKKHMKYHEDNESNKDQHDEQHSSESARQTVFHVDDNVTIIHEDSSLSLSRNIIQRQPPQTSCDNKLTLYAARSSSSNVKDECIELFKQQLVNIDTEQDSILTIDENSVITIVNNPNRMQTTVNDISHIYQAIDPNIIRIQQVHSRSGMNQNATDIGEN